MQKKKRQEHCLLEMDQHIEGFTLEQVPRQQILKGQDGEGEVVVADVPQAAHQGVQVEQSQHLKE